MCTCPSTHERRAHRLICTNLIQIRAYAVLHTLGGGQHVLRRVFSTQHICACMYTQMVTLYMHTNSQKVLPLTKKIRMHLNTFLHAYKRSKLHKHDYINHRCLELTKACRDTVMTCISGLMFACMYMHTHAHIYIISAGTLRHLTDSFETYPRILANMPLFTQKNFAQVGWWRWRMNG